MINGDTYRLADSESISEVFHNHGVNIRYLGKVLESIKCQEYPNIKIILERIILARSLKHVIKRAIRDANKYYITHVIAHLLNCILVFYLLMIPPPLISTCYFRAPSKIKSSLTTILSNGLTSFKRAPMTPPTKRIISK